MKHITLGTRGSKLALAQANLVANALRGAHPNLDVRLHVIKTTGDLYPDKSLATIGGMGVFVKEIEQALLRRDIDVAVHSAKDLPAHLPDGLTIAACLPRGDARDALVVRASAKPGMEVSADNTTSAEASIPSSEEVDMLLSRWLRHGAHVGTGSVRRAAYLLAVRPDLHIKDIRGNVDTRLRLLAEGKYDVLVLAMAGLERLGRTADAGLAVVPLPVELMLPAVAQGTLAIEVRADDKDSLGLLSAINHTDTHATMTAERAFLRVFEAGCQAPIAAHAVVVGSKLRMRGSVGLADGTATARAQSEGDVTDAEETGAALAAQVLRAGGQTILNVTRSSLRPLLGKRVVLTRERERGESLKTKLCALGATPILFPVIAHAPPENRRELDEALVGLSQGKYDWLALTSATAARAIGVWLDERHSAIHARTRIGVVGEATAWACEHWLRRKPDVVPSTFEARALATAMGAGRDQHVLLPGADIALPTLQMALQESGARVDRVVAYRTVCSDAELPSELGEGAVDAIVFTSSSTVQCFIKKTSARDATAVCIGPMTAQAARKAGFARVLVAATATEDGLIEGLIEELIKN